MTVGRPDLESDDVPQLSFVGAPVYLPPRLLAIRLHDGGFQVKSVSHFLLYDASNAENDVLDLKMGEHFRIAGLECRITES